MGETGAGYRSGMLAALREAGCRITAPRRAVVEVLAAGEQHLSHAEVLARARDRYPDVGRATVYRTLELLVGLGQVHVTYLGDACQRFIVPFGGHHHHLVCNDCGDVVEIKECDCSPLLDQVSRRTGFRIDTHNVELFGTCAACR